MVALAHTLAAWLALSGAPPPGLSICLAEEDPPRSVRRDAAGLDVELARALAAELARPLALVWIPTLPQMTEVEESDLPLDNLVRGDCDVLASVPGGEALGRHAGEVALSRPYYGAAFELVGPRTLPASLDALHEHRFAVQTASVAHLALQYAGMSWRAYPSPAEQLAALDRGDADAALVWGPQLGPHGRAPHPDFAPPPALRWNLHLATRARDADLGREIDAALAVLLADGVVARLLTQYGVPAREPFSSVFSTAALEALRGAGP